MLASEITTELFMSISGAIENRIWFQESALTELSLPREMEDAEPILKKAGWHLFAAGYYGALYSKPGVDYVLKLFDNRDRAYRAFLDLIHKFPNKHFPIIKGKPIRITDMYWAVRMEKLLPLSSSAPYIGIYLFTRDKGPHPGNQSQVEAYHKVMAYLAKNPELRTALDLIHDKLLPKYSEDLHQENFMQRSDGTLVIIDPVSN